LESDAGDSYRPMLLVFFTIALIRCLNPSDALQILTITLLIRIQISCIPFVRRDLEPTMQF